MTGKILSIYIYTIHCLQHINADPYIITRIKTHAHVSNMTIYFNHVSENLDFTLKLDQISANLEMVSNEIIPALETALNQANFEGKLNFQHYSNGLLKTLKGCQKNTAVLNHCIDSDKQPNPDDPNIIEMLNEDEFKQDITEVKSFVTSYQTHLTSNKVDSIQRISQLASKISITVGGLVEVVKSFIKQKLSLQQYLFLRNKISQPNLDEKDTDFDISLHKCDTSLLGLRCFGQVEKFSSGQMFAYLKPLIHDECYIGKDIFLSPNNLVEADCHDQDRCVITNTRKTSSCLEAMYNQNYDSIIESCPLRAAQGIQNYPYFSGVIINKASEFISNQIKEIFSSFNDTLPVILSYTGKFKLGKEPQSLEIIRSSSNRLIYQTLPDNISICPTIWNHPIYRMVKEWIVSPYLAIIAGLILSFMFIRGYSKFREIREKRRKQKLARDNIKVMLVQRSRPKNAQRSASVPRSRV